MTAPAPPPSTLFGLSSVAVLGAGWLGRPLALALAAAGYRVRVSTTSAEKSAALAAENLPAHLLVLEPDSAPTDWQAFLGLADALVVTLPPGLRGAPDPAAVATRHIARLARLGALLAGTAVRRVVLLSSTAVYPDLPGAPLLEEADADPTHPLARAEAAFLAALPVGTAGIIARLGGLMGPGRAPGRFFKEGQAIPQAAAPVNMLHLTDAIGAVRALLEAPTAAGAFAVCAAGPPSRADFYDAAARALGRPAPTLSKIDAELVLGKKVSSARLRHLTGYRFRYDEPLVALAAC